MWITVTLPCCQCHGHTSQYFFQNTFNRAVTWVRELRQQATGNIVIILAGNKADLAEEHRAVATEVNSPTSTLLRELTFGITIRPAIWRSADNFGHFGANRAFMVSWPTFT